MTIRIWIQTTWFHHELVLRFLLISASHIDVPATQSLFAQLAVTKVNPESGWRTKVIVLHSARRESCCKSSSITGWQPLPWLFGLPGPCEIMFSWIRMQWPHEATYSNFLTYKYKYLDISRYIYIYLALRKFCISSRKPLQSRAVSQYGQCLDPLPLEWCYPRSPAGCQLLKNAKEVKQIKPKNTLHISALASRISFAHQLYGCRSMGKYSAMKPGFGTTWTPRQLFQRFNRAKSNIMTNVGIVI